MEYLATTITGRLIADLWKQSQKWFLSVAVTILVSPLLVAGEAGSSANSAGDQAKGDVLLKLVRFVKWPDARFILPNSPLVIGVWGDDPPAKVLGSRLEGAVMERRAVTVRSCRSLAAAKGCHVVYVGNPSAALRASDLDQLRDSGVLTVGESPDFLELGGMIRLLVRKDQPRFEVNQGTIRRAGLEVSSQMLKLAVRCRNESVVEGR
jgi:hypothetical protein